VTHSRPAVHVAPRGVRAVVPAAALLLIALVLAAPSGATSLPSRTLRVSVPPDGGVADGASTNPVLSATGRVLAFDSTATNLGSDDPNGPTRDVVAIDLATNERRLVSAGGDGDSSSPTVSKDGQRVAFVSSATNLVPGDTNGQPDVFLRDGRGPIVRLSVAAGGAEANGASLQPDLSADGRYVVFTSTASNLVPDDTNDKADLFVRDLATNTISRVSISSSGEQGNGRSSGPSISADGSTVAFESAASNLVPKDNNGVSDVFVRSLRTKKTERVSVNSDERQQDKSVAPPFTQIADVSKDGRYVVFDSDATNLYAQDTNKHTDVFLRDRKSGTTTLISASSVNVQGNNDSFAPRMTPDGRFVSFQSFATNLAAGDGPREDIFLRDLQQGTTTVVNVTADGSPREGELVPQLLQRPAISNDGTFAAFSSTVPNLTDGDANAAEDVFVRLLDPPVGRVVSKPKPDHAGVVRVTADDPLARNFVCQVDLQQPFLCGASINLPAHAGAVLKVRAGGPGMLFDSTVMRVSLTNDHAPPSVRITIPKGHRISVLRGRASDTSSGVGRVEVAFVYLTKSGCRYLNTRTTFKKGSCLSQHKVVATGTRRWHLRLPKAVRGPYALYARAVDRAGNASKLKVLKGVVI
jgi:Tol biopolymer transport system component